MPPTTLTAPYGIGDTLYVIEERDTTVYTPCPSCGTAGHFMVAAVNGEPLRIDCPTCGGAGKRRVGKGRKVFDVKGKKITGVRLAVGEAQHRRNAVEYLIGGSTVDREASDAEPRGSFTRGVPFWAARADAKAVAERWTREVDKAAGFTDTQVVTVDDQYSGPAGAATKGAPTDG